MKIKPIRREQSKPFEDEWVCRARALSVVALVVMCVGAASASAQGPPGQPPRVTEFAEKVGLDEETVAKLREVEGAGRREGQAIRLRLDVLNAELRELLGSDTPDESEAMQKADAIGKLETDARKIRLRTMIRVRSLLTPEQREKLMRIHGERKRRRGGMHDGPGGPRRHGPPGPPRF